jgi:hypothetical protein
MKLLHQLSREELERIAEGVFGILFIEDAEEVLDELPEGLEPNDEVVSTEKEWEGADALDRIRDVLHDEGFHPSDEDHGQHYERGEHPVPDAGQVRDAVSFLRGMADGEDDELGQACEGIADLLVRLGDRIGHVNDNRISHVWACHQPGCTSRHEANGKVTEVPPTFYEEAGTPICEDCGEDLTYLRTRIE